MDWSEKNSCIKCDDGGNLLNCSEGGCPLAVHERCLGFPAKLDDSGRFYCPYCLYRQAVAESRKARENALERKKALLVFMDEKVIGSEKHLGGSVTREGNGRNQSKTSEANGNIVSSDDGKSQSNDHGISDQPFQFDGEEKMGNGEKDINDSAGSEGADPSLEMHGGKSNGLDEENHVEEEEHESDAVEEEQIQVEEHKTNAAKEEKTETSSASSDQDPSLTRHARATRGSKRSKQVDKHSDADPEHARATRRSKRSKQMDKDSDADPERNERLSLKQHGKKKLTSATVTPTRRASRKSSSAMRTEKVSNEIVGSPRRLRKAEEPSIKLASDMSGRAKRRRLLWTEEEEETLRAGVETFAHEKINLPWKKILWLGRKQYHGTRTPSDLKDKWRQMSGKVREDK